MIFVDANYFIRTMARPKSPREEAWAREARALMASVGAGERQITTSEAVIAEVAFVLTSPRHYGLAPDHACGRLRALLALRGLRFPQKRMCLRALDIWTVHPRIGFVDSLAAAYAQQPGMELATFDSDFDPITGITRFQP